MIKIKADILKNFMEKTTGSGLVNNGKLVFSESGLKMCHKDEMGVVLIAGTLAKSNFFECETAEISVKSMDSFIKILRSFKETLVNIIVQKNAFKVMSGDTSYDIVMAEDVSCYREAGVPDIPFDAGNKTILKKEIMQKIIDASANVSTDTVVLSNANKKLVFQIGQETDKAQVETMSTITEDLVTTFSLDYFKKLTDKMDIIVDFSMGGDSPSKFEEKTDKYQVMYLITPIISEEEKK